MKTQYTVYNTSVEFTVKSEMYGITTCVVNIESFKNGRTLFPCGDGCDYKLNYKEINAIQRALKEVK